MKALTDDILQWSVFNAEKGYDFNGLHLRLADRCVLVDPVPMSADVVAEVERRGRPALIILTNKDHRRDAPEAARRFAAPVVIHHLDRPMIDVPVDDSFDDGDLLGGELEVVRVPDAKSPGESALWWARRRVLIVGDAVIGKPPGQVSMLPDGKFRDPVAARRGLVRLATYPAELLLVGDGASITSGAGGVIERFLSGRNPS
ncbi:MAG TPA: MBL fold metallo-hydrolase [Kofleriaceae bacterium]|nr:MBL fold metallo-hydrolase [Kofleriaceae bacterium]